MKLTAQVKLQPTPDQAAALLDTLMRANTAANAMSQVAWETQTFSQLHLHKLVYAPTRATSGLAAQVVIRLEAKVADAYKRDHKVQRRFHRHGAISYDARILAWHPDAVSIWTTSGRQRIGFVCDERAWGLLAHQRGESDLLYRSGLGFLAATVNFREPQTAPPADYLGVDLGIVNLATDSEGTVYSGAQVRSLRRRHARLRAKLQAKGTRAAKRLLRKRRRKEPRFATQVNHHISQRLVAQAQGTQRGIAPRNTSRTCPACGHCAKGNRVSQRKFLCEQCGFAGLADHIAAENIRRAAVNQPYSTGAVPTAVS